MAGTFSQILLHAVFSTKGREPWISTDVATRLYPYMGGVIRAKDGVLLEIGGVEDHVHLYFRWRPDESIAALMRTIKSRSSRWMHKNFPSIGRFAWQDGYGVFSVSKSQEQKIRRYISRQCEHHKRQSFRGELTALLKAHGVAFEDWHLD